MADSKRRTGSKEERLLILAIDIDNDLFRKTRISGPLMGKQQLLNGAEKLALADPEDPDSNTMFYAIKLYDELREDGYLVNVATVTGSELEGYHADAEIARQLELVLEQNKSDACILVTDGASDQRIMPIINSRIKVNSVQVVTLKQAESFENTYFTILEKLKEPHYSRIVFGLPALLLLLFAVSYLIGAGWVLPIAIIGLYLLIKGFGLEEGFLNSFRGFGFSVDRMSFAFYLSSLLFIVAGIFIAYGNYTSTMSVTSNKPLAITNTIEGFLIIVPIALILLLVGRIIDIRSTKHVFRTFKYGIYLGSSLILWVLLYSFTAWISAQIYFGQLLLFIILAIVFGIAISSFASFLRRRVLMSSKLNGKNVVNELGVMIGRITKVDVKRGKVIINTSFGNPVTYGVDRITEISDKVVIR
ncbi:MAG: DUF373 family protein [Candidatus Micrarchaeaceae archaeon]